VSVEPLAVGLENVGGQGQMEVGEWTVERVAEVELAVWVVVVSWW
jgi:hypothetical protein